MIIEASEFVQALGVEFFVGVPDSLLKPLCDYLIGVYGIDPGHHIIAANEGNCVALAAGYHLATGRVPAVYLQNSGEGNIINPVASLLNEKVYGIPCIFIVGWRGEPGVHDEPQHIYQGEITLKLLDDMGITYYVLDKDTSEDQIKTVLKTFRLVLASGRCVAFVVRKGALTYRDHMSYSNENRMTREEILWHVLHASGEDPIVSTTGKASRELFELRDRNGQSHERDFLTVGSMGHCSSIALGIALNKPGARIWCLDGDGSVLMHMGAMAVIGSLHPENLIHIVVNNAAHETVGGMPTVAGQIDLIAIAKACGYSYTFRVNDFDQLDQALEDARSLHTLSFIEAKSYIGARSNLGRPTTTAMENKQHFMEYLRGFQ